MAREVTHRYVDPLAQVWTGAARRIGLSVERTEDAYASTDGRGTLAIGADAALDADDSLGQMIFHELCHSLVEGEPSFARPDWGMDNTGPDHDWREHACLRVQWVLAGRHGLRAVLAPTTEFRAFWDALAGDVLADRRDRSVVAAIAGLRRAEHPPWAPALGDALAATARIAAEAARFAGPDERSESTLWRAALPAPAPHPTGLPAGDADATCASCAWRHDHRGRARCRQAGVKIDPAWRACERYEPALDCQGCGACCRAAYHSVEVARRDPAVKAHPELVVDRGSYLELRRDGDRCAALHGGTPATPRYHCVIYDDRPRTCRDFTLGSEHCLTARRRVGLSFVTGGNPRGMMRDRPCMRVLVLALVAACTAPMPAAPPAAPSRDLALALIEASPDLDRAVVGPTDAPATIAVVFASWCSHCRHELGVLSRALAAAPGARVLGVNYRGHEEYAARGSSGAVRTYVAANAPWLRVVPADEALFAALGRPPVVPTIDVDDRAGALVAKYDRRDRELPGEGELAGLLRELAGRDQRRR